MATSKFTFSTNMSVQTSSVVPRSLEDLAQPHIESFDYFIQDGMRNLVENMRPVEVRDTPHSSMILAGNLVDHSSPVSS